MAFYLPTFPLFFFFFHSADHNTLHYTPVAMNYQSLLLEHLDPLSASLRSLWDAGVEENNQIWNTIIWSVIIACIVFGCQHLLWDKVLRLCKDPNFCISAIPDYVSVLPT